MVTIVKKIFKITAIILLLTFFVSSIHAADEDGFYYSEKMVKNGTFTWEVTQNENNNELVDVYSVLNVGANFTVRLRDSLYPGPISEEELESVYASIEVDGEKYTGSGFPLFWHVEKIENDTITTIREDFEAEPELFNVTDSGSNFLVNFTIPDVFMVEQTNYTLFVELEIDPTDGLTVRYFDTLFNGTIAENIFEMEFVDYTVTAPLNFIWVAGGLVSLSVIVWLVKKRKK